MKRQGTRVRDLERLAEPPDEFVPVLTLTVRNPDGTVETKYDSRDHAEPVPARVPFKRRP